MSLLIIAIALWTKILFFNSKKKDYRKQQSINTKPAAKAKSSRVKTITRKDLIKKYNFKNKRRKNLFFQDDDSKASFTYQNNLDFNPLDLDQLDLNLKLKGVIKQDNQTIAIINYNGQSLFLKTGDEISGFKVLKIRSNKVDFIKDKKKFFSTIKVNK